MPRQVPRKTPTCAVVVLLAAVIFALPATAHSQDEPTSAIGSAPPPVGYDPQDLAQRLAAAEAKILALEKQHEQHNTLLETLQDRWANIKDPAITSVDQQTHGASTEGTHWYERLSVRGYAQMRLNTTTVEDPDGAPAQLVSDRSVGSDQNFFLRRARLIISGDISDRLYVFLQPEFAATISGSDSIDYGQIRDWYGDVYLDDDKVYRIRLGQSRVPYGWENLQASSNRAPLDRADAFESASRNLRDLGVFFYWTPEAAQDLFKYVLDEGLKGSGNYGVFAFGVYNGQGGSTNEANDDVSVVTRLAVPYQFENKQVMELGIQAYTGKFGVNSAPIQPLGIGPAARPLGTLQTGDNGIRDERLGGTFVWYPQPFGVQAEWNIGNGPSLNDAQTRVVNRSLTGGYAMLLYREKTEDWGTFFPYARATYYDGGLKNENNAPHAQIHEYNTGLEWQFNPQMELTTEYVWTNRTNTQALTVGESYLQFKGQLLRFQFQFNY